MDLSDSRKSREEEKVEREEISTPITVQLIAE